MVTGRETHRPPRDEGQLQDRLAEIPPLQPPPALNDEIESELIRSDHSLPHDPAPSDQAQSHQTHSQAEAYKPSKQSWLISKAKELRDPVNRWFARQSLIPDDALIDAAHLPQLADMEERWQAIHAEAQALLTGPEKIPAFGKISPDHRRIATNSAWKSFFLEGYGFKPQANRALCPETVAMLEEIPGLVVAFFSIMEPGTYVPSHRGLTKAWLNCHLPLMVPKGSGRCEMRVGDTMTRWQEGRWLIFDETVEHEVWNESDEVRIVLFLQVRRPMTRIGNWAASLLFRIIRRTGFVRDANKAITASRQPD